MKLGRGRRSRGPWGSFGRRPATPVGEGAVAAVRSQRVAARPSPVARIHVHGQEWGRPSSRGVEREAAQCRRGTRGGPPGRGRATPRATPCAAPHATSSLCSTPVQPCAAPRATSALCSTPHAGKAGDGPDAPHLGPSPSRRWASSATSSGVEGGGWELSSGDTAWG